MSIRLILASGSPRRSEILTRQGFEFDIVKSTCEEITEKTNPAEVVKDLSMQKAQDVCEKLPDGRDYLILAADTVVAVDDTILGKPSDEAEAADMIRHIQGRRHQVYTGVTLIYKQGKLSNDKCSGVSESNDKCSELSESNDKCSELSESNDKCSELSESNDKCSVMSVNNDNSTKAYQPINFAECTHVDVYPMNEQEIEAYIATGEPMDKAGAYGIQGIFSEYVKGIDGNYDNVVGLPIARIYHECELLRDITGSGCHLLLSEA